MNTLRILFRELWHHRFNALLSALGLTCAVALTVASWMTTAAAERETRRVMRDLGFNLRVIPRSTDMDHFWTHGYSDQTMPADTARRLAAQNGIFLSFNHLTPTLEGRLRHADREWLLCGIGETIVGPGEVKQPMGFRIPKGQVYLGSAVAERLGAKRGGTVNLATGAFTVERVLAESGTDEDIRIYGALGDVQALLGQPDRINEIKAIDCLCLTADQDPLSKLRATLEQALPETKVLQLRSVADARARQRRMAERYAHFAVPIVLVSASVWIALLSWLNVRERAVEIGLWRALGHGSFHIVRLFLGKAVVLGLLGGIAGYASGTTLALRTGPEIFQVTAKSLHADPRLLAWAVLLTPVFAIVASLLPTFHAVSRDPAETLRSD